jgi:hypothetical protein
MPRLFSGVISRDCIIGANTVPYHLSVTVFRDFARVAFASTNSSHRCLEEGHSCSEQVIFSKCLKLQRVRSPPPPSDLHTFTDIHLQLHVSFTISGRVLLARFSKSSTPKMIQLSLEKWAQLEQNSRKH